MINILLIEDHDILRQAMEHRLGKSTRLNIIGSAGTAKEGVSLARTQSPDIVLLDYQLPDGNGLEVTQLLRHHCPDAKVFIISAIKNPAIILQLLKAGATGYLSKEHGYEDLERAILKVHHGQRYLSEDVANAIALRKVDIDQETPFDQLSPREMEVSLLILDGKTVTEMAKQLRLSSKTIHSYRYRIQEKTHTKTDLELLRLAVQFDLLELEEVPLSDDDALI